MLFVARTLIFIFGLCYGVNTQCTSSGRFPNDLVEDCRGYTTCIAAANTFYQYELGCPPNFVFNHFDKQCTNATGYQCLPYYNCTELGTFPNPLSSDCTSYVVCIQSLTSISARLVDCPTNTSFNVNEKLCMDNSVYKCPDIVTDMATVSAAIDNATTTTTAVPTPNIKETKTNIVGNNASYRNYKLVPYLTIFFLNIMLST